MSRGKRVALVVFLIVVVVCLVVAWRIVRRGFSAHGQPSAAEAVVARLARRLAVPADMRNLKNPRPPAPENIREGMEHFADHCAICHANNGSGNTTFGSNMYPHPPDMRTRTQQLTDGEIYATIQNGIRLTGMPAFGQPGEKDSVASWNLVLFIRHLPQLTPEEEAAMRALNPKTAAEWREEQEAEDFLSGKEEGPPKPPQTPGAKQH